MRGWKVLVLVGLAVLITAGALFAELRPLTPTVRPLQPTTINVVCLQEGFPASAQVTLAQIDRAGNTVPGTETAPIDASDGFASFQVTKYLSYRVTARKERRGFRVRELVATRDLRNISTAAFVPLELSSEPATATETSINVVCLWKETPKANCLVFLSEVDREGEIIRGSTSSELARDGFVSFRVVKRRNYSWRAEDVYPASGGREMSGLLHGNDKIIDIRSAAVRALLLKSGEASLQGTSGEPLLEYSKDKVQRVPPTVRPMPR